MRGANFCELLQPAGLKSWSFKDQQAQLAPFTSPMLSTNTKPTAGSNSAQTLAA